MRVVLLADAPLDRLFVHTGGEDERDRQLLDDLGLSGVRAHLCYLPCCIEFHHIICLCGVITNCFAVPTHGMVNHPFGVKSEWE